jgi:hypothetical protein
MRCGTEPQIRDVCLQSGTDALPGGWRSITGLQPYLNICAYLFLFTAVYFAFQYEVGLTIKLGSNK